MMNVLFGQFDKILWRLNGVLILILALGGVSLTFYGLYRSFFETRKQAVDLVDKRTNKIGYLRLGRLEKINGTDYTLIPLASEDKPEVKSGTKFKSSGYYSDSNVRNFLLVNTKTRTNEWVWDKNDKLIVSDTVLCRSPCSDEKSVATGISFELVENDTNNNSSLDENDKKIIQFLHLKTGKLITVASGVDRVIGIQVTRDNEALFFFSVDGKSFYKSLDVISGEISSNNEILLTNN